MRRTRQTTKSSSSTQCLKESSPNVTDEDRSVNGTVAEQNLRSKRIKLLETNLEHLVVKESVNISFDSNSNDANNSKIESLQKDDRKRRSRVLRKPRPSTPVSETNSISDEEYDAAEDSSTSSSSSSDSDSSFDESSKTSKRTPNQAKKKGSVDRFSKGNTPRSRLSLNIAQKLDRPPQLKNPTLSSKNEKCASKLNLDESSDSSSDEFLRVRPSDALPEELKSECFTIKNKELTNDSSVSNSLLPMLTGTTLSSSDSEVEYTQVDWPCIPELSHTHTEVAVPVTKDAETSYIRKKPSRSGGRRKGGASINKASTSKDEGKPLDVLELLMLGEGLSSEARNIGKYVASEDDVTDLEEVSMDEEMVLEDNKPKHPTIPKEGVQITVKLPEIAQKKKKGFDMNAYLLRRLNDRKRSIQVLIHKVHILAYLAHGRFVNSVLNSEILMGLSLSLIPSRHCYPPKRADLGYLEQFVTWFVKTIRLNEDLIAKYPADLLASLQEQFNARSAFSKRDLVFMFICLLRSLGIKTRLVLSLQPAPLKLGTSDLCTVLPTKVGTNKPTAMPQVKQEQKEVKQEQKDVNAASTKAENHKSRSKKTSQKPSNCSKSLKGKRSVKQSKYFDKTKKCKNDKPTESKSKYFSSDKSMDKEEIEKPSTSSPAKKTINEKPTTEKGSKYFSKTSDKKKTEAKSRKSQPSDNAKSPSAKNAKNVSSRSAPDESEDRKPKAPAAGRKTQPNRQSKTKVKIKSEITSEESDFEPESKRPKRKASSCPVNVVAESKPKNKPASRRTSNTSRRKPSVKTKIKSENSNSDSDFAPEEAHIDPETSDTADDSSSKSDRDELVIVKKPPKEWSGKLDRRVLSSDSSDTETKKKTVKTKRPSKDVKRVDKKQGIDVWCEVYLEAEEKWFCVDVPKKKVHCYADLHSKATQPVLYVVSFNPDLSLKDVTRRYVVNWSTIKQRVDETWWEKTLRPFVGKQTPQDREEEEELSNNMLNHPLPTSIGEYKNHPLYVLKRHLLKFEAIYPADAPTLGFVRGEAVYSRDCVVGLHSREVWVKEAKVVKPGEEPYKIVKARPKYDKLSGNVISDLPLEVFGEWQVGEYIPPTAENGKVPRNEYGNVELFKPCMLPKGCVHLPIPGLSRVAKKLGIDCAPAMIGFDYHSGGSHPTYDGYVICEEHKEIMLDAWKQEVEESEKRAAEKLEKRVYGNWKRLIRGLLIRERLKERYSFGEPKPSTSKAKASTSKKTQRKR